MNYMCTVCVVFACGQVGWLWGASGAIKWLTSPQMLLHIDEAAHLIVNPSLHNHTNVCVCVFVWPSLQLSACFLTLFLLLYFNLRYRFLPEPPPQGFPMEDSDLRFAAVNLLCSFFVTVDRKFKNRLTSLWPSFRKSEEHLGQFNCW